MFVVRFLGVFFLYEWCVTCLSPLHEHCTSPSLIFSDLSFGLEKHTFKELYSFKYVFFLDFHNTDDNVVISNDLSWHICFFPTPPPPQNKKISACFCIFL